MPESFVRRIDIHDSEIMVPVDIQGAYINVPVDIKEQSVDLTTQPKYFQDKGSVTGIDAETVVLDLNLRPFKFAGISLKNIGANDLIYRIVALVHYDGVHEHEIVPDTTLAAGAMALESIDARYYARIKVYARAATSGSPSDLEYEAIRKS